MVELRLPSFFQDPGGSFVPGGPGDDDPGEAQVLDVRVVGGPTGPTDRPSIPRLGAFSSEAADTFDAVREQLKAELGIAEERDLSFRLNRAARDFFDVNGRWPSVSELMAFQPMWDMMMPLVTGMFALPPVFEADGALYRNDFLTGIKLTSTGMLEPTRELGLDPRLFEGMDQAEIDFLNRAQPTPGNAIVSRRGVPSLTIDAIADIMSRSSAIRPGGGGRGRRGGGGGRASRVFDAAEVERNVRDLWGAVLEQEPPDASALAAEYMREANAFWMSEGGNLDFETWLMTRIEATPRYAMWYRNKPDGQSALQYKAAYANLVSQFGLQPAQATREMGVSMSQGAGAAGAAERIGRTQQVQAASRGNISQRYAATIAGLGVAG